MPNGPIFKCQLNSGQPNHLNTGQMDTILFSYVMVQYSNGRSNSEVSDIQILTVHEIQRHPNSRYSIRTFFFDIGVIVYPLITMTL